MFFPPRVGFSQFPYCETSIHTWQLSRHRSMWTNSYLFMLRPSISGSTAPLVAFLSVFVPPMELPQQAISCLGKNTPRSVSEWNPLCLPTFSLCDVKPRCWATICASKINHMKEKIICWPHRLIYSNVFDQSVKGWICILEERWGKFASSRRIDELFTTLAVRAESCDRSLIVNASPPPLFFSFSSYRGRRIEFQVISLVSQDSPRLNPKCNSIRGKQLLDTGARTRRERGGTAGWDPSSRVIWVTAGSWQEPPSSTRHAFDTGRWHAGLPARHVTRVASFRDWADTTSSSCCYQARRCCFLEASLGKSGEPHGRITQRLLFRRNEHTSSSSHGSHTINLTRASGAI